MRAYRIGIGPTGSVPKELVPGCGGYSHEAYVRARLYRVSWRGRPPKDRVMSKHATVDAVGLGISQRHFLKLMEGMPIVTCAGAPPLRLIEWARTRQTMDGLGACAAFHVALVDPAGGQHVCEPCAEHGPGLVCRWLGPCAALALLDRAHFGWRSWRVYLPLA